MKWLRNQGVWPVHHPGSSNRPRWNWQPGVSHWTLQDIDTIWFKKIPCKIFIKLKTSEIIDYTYVYILNLLTFFWVTSDWIGLVESGRSPSKSVCHQPIASSNARRPVATMESASSEHGLVGKNDASNWLDYDVTILGTWCGIAMS